MSAIYKPQHGINDLIVNALNLGVVVLDAAGNVLVWNDWMARHSGITQLTAIGNPLNTVFATGLPTSLNAALANVRRYKLPVLLSNALHRHPFPLFANPHKEGQERLQQSVSITPLENDSGVQFCLIQISDRSTSVKRERVLQAQSNRFAQASILDGLTGAYNRRYFDERCKIELSRAQRQQRALSLIMIDVDHFKLYNDNYGHPAGDSVLINVVNTLKKHINRAGELIARYGGEEFAVILPESDERVSLALAQKLCHSVADLRIPHKASLVTSHITISLGVATFLSGANCDSACLLQYADQALYLAKEAGRNQVVGLTIHEGSQANAACNITPASH